MSGGERLKKIIWLGSNLHAFQKKSKRGRQNTTIRDRADSTTAARGRRNREGDGAVTRKSYEISSGNLFKDISVANAAEHLVKAQLVFKIEALLKRRGLTQVAAARLFGVRQPDISKMLRGEFRQFSVERLLRFLVALDQDVSIVVKPNRSKTKTAALNVA